MIDCSKTENYFAEKRRMTKRPKDGPCGIDCAECPLFYTNNGSPELMGCSGFEMYSPEKAIEVVQKWSDEHPQRTYLTEFLKHFPNAPLHVTGILTGIPKDICPYHLGFMSIDDCRKDHNCVKCWNQPVEVEESEKNGIS